MFRIFALASEHKGLLVLSGILAALATIASFVPYLAIYCVVRDVVVAYPDFVALDSSAIMGYGMLALVGVLADVVLFFFSSVCAHIAAFGTQYTMKSSFTKHLAKIPLGYHLNVGVGRFRKVIDEDIEKIENFLAHSFPDIVASVTAPFVMLVVLFAFDWRFGLAALVAIIVACALQMMTFGAAGPQLMKRMQETLAEMTSASIEYVRGMPVLKAFGQTANSFGQLRESLRSYTGFMLTYTMRWKNYTAAFNAVINNMYLFIVPVGLILGPGTQDYASFALTFMFYLIFVPSMASVLNKLMYVASSSMRIAQGVAHYDSIMDIPELQEPSVAKRATGTDVVFNDVSFSYTQGGREALSHVSFTARPGTLTAIVGPSGGGKSTVAHLVPRFWDVDDGTILLGGTDIRTMDEEYLMQQVSSVFQDTFLFGQSIKENIRMGNLSASDEEVIAAARAAQCHEFVEALPCGYDTVIGEEGIHLSGGEQQRISIARAIIKDAPILILDEATAFADPQNEQYIQRALSALMAEKTVIMIAHRLGTILHADTIVVLRDGEVVEQGTHDLLLAQEGLYANMWAHYLQTISWKIGVRKGCVGNEHA